MRSTRTTKVAVITAGLAISVAACGSSSNKAGSPTATPTSGGSASAGAAPSGDPLKIMYIGPTGTNLANWPASVAAAKAAARGINSRGGIKGRPVELVYCNEKNVPGQGAICAQQAADEGFLAVVGSFNNAGGVIAPLAKAGIPSVGDAGTSALGDATSSPVSFVLSALPVANAACPALLKEQGSKAASVLAQNFPAAVKFAGLVGAGAKAYSYNVVGKGIFYDPQTTDYAPVIQQLQRTGADSAILATTEQGSISVLQAADAKFKFCHSDASVTEANLKKLGKAASTYSVVGTFPPISEASNYTLGKRMLAELDAELAAGDQDAAPDLRQSFGTFNPWFAMYVVETVGNKVTGALDSKALLAALHATTALDSGGLIPTLDLSKPATQVPELKSVYGGSIRAEKWDAAAQKFSTIKGLTLSMNDFLGPKPS